MYTRPNELYHSGVKGMKWGVRRFQNEDGTITPAGKEHYKQVGGCGYDPSNSGKQKKEGLIKHISRRIKKYFKNRKPLSDDEKKSTSGTSEKNGRWQIV